MSRFSLSSIFVILLGTGVAGCAGSTAGKSNLDQAIDDAAIGEVIKVGDTTFKKVAPGTAVSCKAPCSNIPVQSGN